MSFDYAGALAQCAAGDRRAMRQLFDEEAGRLLSVTQRIVRRKELAEEVVQEAFIQIWQKAGTFDASVGSARAWIYTIARNKALNMVRDGSREDLVDAEGMDRLHEPGIMIGDAVERLAADSRLRHCLETIEPRKRDSILLSYVAGFSHGEIAGLLGVPVGTAKSWVKRGVAALRDCVS